MCNLHCKFHFRSLYMDFMPRSQISFQLATPLLDFILFWLLIPSWMNLFHCGFHFSCYFSHTYHFSYSLHCRFHFSLYFHWGFHLISHFHVHHRLHFRSYSNFPNTLISKGTKFISLFSPFSPPSLSLSLCFSWLWVSLASLQQVSAASLQQVSPPDCFNRFLWLRFIRCTSKKKSFASY